MKKIGYPILLLALSLGTFPLRAQEKLTLLDDYQFYQDDANALYKEIVHEATNLLETREAQIATLTTAEDWQTYRNAVRDTLTQLLGPFPDKTPLNPKITGVLERDGIRVEKLIYESQPGFYVTAALFLPPTVSGKAPAIVYCSGHSPLGFRSDTYQTAIMNLAKKGFVVLAFDPLGQGERMQYPDRQGHSSLVGGPTHEHSYAGAQCFITGSSMANYMIWDAIRAVDYLVSRPEVDPQRIGMTGRSGGGTQTTYAAALDDRIRAAAPEAYITRLSILFKTRGPQDAEQNIPYLVSRQLDLSDFLIARAPQPTLIISTTRDIFSIEGARDSYHEAKQAFEALGKASNLSMSEDDTVHASTLKNREAMYAFFQKHLHHPGNPREEKVTVFGPEELWATAHGQVATDLNSKNVFDLNRITALQKKEAIRQSRSNFNAQKTIREAKRVSGFQRPVGLPDVHFAGQYSREGYRVQKYLMLGEKHVNPFLLFVPDQARPEELVVYFHPEGKTAQAGVGQEIESLVKQGMTVLAADVLGTGELGPGYLRGDAYIDSVSYNQWFGAILVDKSIVARQAEDMVKMVQYLMRSSDSGKVNVTAVAHRTLTPALLHAAAFEPTIKRTILIEPLVSYETLLTHEMYDARWVHASLAGAMDAYDLADLAACLAPRKLLIIDPLDHAFQKVNAADVKEWAVVQEQYESSDFRMIFSNKENVSERITDWLK